MLIKSGKDLLSRPSLNSHLLFFLNVPTLILIFEGKTKTYMDEDQLMVMGTNSL